MKTLETELDWKYYGGKHYESKYTGFVQSYIQPVKFNVDYRKATFSTQICAGTMTRDEAVKELEKTSYNIDTVEQEMEYIAKKFRITLQEFKALLDTPPVSYKEYPNDEKRLTFIYDTYKKIKGIS